MEQVEKLLPEFPAGPLDVYRKQSSFNWKKLRCYIEDPKLLAFKLKVWRTLEADPLFQHSPLTPSLEEYRELTTRRMFRIRDYDFCSHVNQMSVEGRLMLMHLLVVMYEYDASLCLKYTVPFTFFLSSVFGLGGTSHLEIIDSLEKEELTGCFALTEISHGTNAKQLRTTATFDPRTQEFIIHTADFEAAKCWVGSLGKSSTHATVFAQLITPDGVNHGLHAFIVPVRDPKTMLLYPGVITGDMGEKLGLNAVDNGFAIFTNYRIPKENLLNKTSSISPEGQYITRIKDPRKRFGASLGALVAGRVAVNLISVVGLVKAVVIATRYSAVRCQFGPENAEELPVLEYQLQQCRLIPYLASAFVLKVLADSCVKSFLDFYLGMLSDEDKDKLNYLGAEIHVIQASSKPLCSSTAQQAIQECREACGGHGYLKCSGFGNLRNDNDANCTYEGDNNVLCQQTSNWLLQIWGQRHIEANGHNTPLGSIDFMYRRPAEQILRSQFTSKTVQEVSHPENILSTYEWLITYLLQNTYNKYQSQLREGNDPFTAKNNSQMYHAQPLSMAYIQHFAILTFWKVCNKQMEPECRQVLSRICSLYGLWCLEKHLATLYEGGFAVGSLPSQLIRQAIIQLCEELKPDVVSLADALAPTDFILNSAIGKSDGLVYKNLQNAIYQTPGFMERPSWWTEMIGPLRSRL